MACSGGRFLFGLLAVSIMVRILAVLVVGLPPVSDHADYHTMAIGIASGDGFGSEGHTPPGTPVLLAIFYRIFGGSVLVGQLVEVVLGGLFVWLSYAVGRQIVPEACARIAGILAAFFPGLVLYSTVLCYSIPLGCAWLFLIWLFLRRTPSRHAWWYVGVLGSVTGVLCLIKPIGLIFPVIMAFFYWRRGTSMARSVRNGLLLLIGMCVVLAPWTWRNYRLFQTFAPVVTSSGIGLWVTNHPGAGPQTCPFPELDVFDGDRALRDQHLRREAVTFLREHPEHLLLNYPGKAAYMWGTSSSIMAFVSADRWPGWAEHVAKGSINFWWAFVCALFVVSVWHHGFCRSSLVFYPAVGFLAVLWGIHIVFEAQSKYHLPLMPILFMGAAVALLNKRALDDETLESGNEVQASSTP